MLKDLKPQAQPPCGGKNNDLYSEMIYWPFLCKIKKYAAMSISSNSAQPGFSRL